MPYREVGPPSFRGNTLRDVANGGDDYARILYQGANAQSAAALQSGDAWANAIGGIGNIATDYFHRRDAKKADEAIRTATSPQYPSATKPVPGSEADVPDPAADHMQQIMSRVSPDQRPRVEKSILDFQAASKKAKDAEAVAEQHKKDAIAVGAYHAKDFFDSADGGLGAVNVLVAQAKHAGFDVKQYEQFVGQANAGWEKSQQDPAGVEAFKKAFQQQAGPLLDQLTMGASPEVMEKFKPKAKEGFSLSPGQIRYDADGKPIANAPAAPKEPTAFNLGPGDVRYDGQGNVIASRPAAPAKPGEKFWVMRNGQPIRVSESEYLPGDKPASTREQGRPVTSGDAGRVAEMDTALDEANALAEKITGNKATGVSAKVGTLVPDVVTEFTGWGSDAKIKEGTINLVKQIIGKGLEGGVLRKEDEYKYAKILPTISDNQEVVAGKMEGLWKALQQKRQNHLDSLSDAGYDTTKYAARPPRERKVPDSGGLKKYTSKAEVDALAPGTHFLGPDGVERVR